MSTYLVHVPSKHPGDVITIVGSTFFLARASAAVRFKVDPADIRPAVRKVMAKS